MDFWVSKICLEWWIPFTALNRFSFSNRHYNMGLNKLPWWKGPASAVLFCWVYVQKYASRSVVWAQVPEVDTAVRSLTVMWDGSLVVAANNHGTCYVWRLLRGNQVVALVIHFLMYIDMITHWRKFDLPYTCSVADYDQLWATSQATSTWWIHS